MSSIVVRHLNSFTSDGLADWMRGDAGTSPLREDWEVETPDGGEHHLAVGGITGQQVSDTFKKVAYPYTRDAVLLRKKTDSSFKASLSDKGSGEEFDHFVIQIDARDVPPGSQNYEALKSVIKEWARRAQSAGVPKRYDGMRLAAISEHLEQKEIHLHALVSRVTWAAPNQVTPMNNTGTSRLNAEMQILRSMLVQAGFPDDMIALFSRGGQDLKRQWSSEDYRRETQITRPTAAEAQDEGELPSPAAEESPIPSPTPQPVQQVSIPKYTPAWQQRTEQRQRDLASISPDAAKLSALLNYYEAQIDKLNEGRQLALNALAALYQQTAIQDKFNRVSVELRDAQIKISSLESENNELKQENEQAATENEGLHNALANKAREVGRLQENYQEQLEKNGQLAESVSKVSSEKQELAEKLEGMENDYANLEEEFKESESTRQSLESELGAVAGAVAGALEASGEQVPAEVAEAGPARQVSWLGSIFSGFRERLAEFGKTKEQLEREKREREQDRVAFEKTAKDVAEKHKEEKKTLTDRIRELTESAQAQLGAWGERLDKMLGRAESAEARAEKLEAEKRELEETRKRDQAQAEQQRVGLLEVATEIKQAIQAGKPEDMLDGLKKFGNLIGFRFETEPKPEEMKKPAKKKGPGTGPGPGQ